MKLLAIETSSDACSAALLVDGAVFVEFDSTPRAHTRLILPMVESVLAKAALSLNEVDALAFGQGPGAFTGVRIATGVIQGLALAANKPVIAISSLAALAQQVYSQYGHKQVLVAVDARMQECYWGEYQYLHGRMQRVGLEQLLAPDQLVLPSNLGNYVGVGSAWQVYQSELSTTLMGQPFNDYAELLPSAEHIAQLAAFEWQAANIISADQAQPVYLRNKVAQTTEERAALSGL